MDLDAQLQKSYAPKSIKKTEATGLPGLYDTIKDQVSIVSREVRANQGSSNTQ